MTIVYGVKKNCMFNIIYPKFGFGAWNFRAMNKEKSVGHGRKCMKIILIMFQTEDEEIFFINTH